MKDLERQVDHMMDMMYAIVRDMIAQLVGNTLIMFQSHTGSHVALIIAIIVTYLYDSK